MVEYIHLPAGADIPDLAPAPRRLLVIAEQAVPTEWMNAVSDWIVRSGSLFVMAWGTGCEDWHDSVDNAYLVHHDFGEVADEHFMLTTWHDSEPLKETFWFAAACASHPTIDLPMITLLDIAPEPRGDEILAQYEAERASAGDDQNSDDGHALPRSYKV